MVNTTKFDKEYFRLWFKNLSPEKRELRNLQRTEIRKAKKAYWVIKKGDKCFDCNKQYPNCVYEFHHVDPATKDTTPSKLFMLSDNSIEKELNKCIMLCANCHRIRHHNDNYIAHRKRNLKDKSNGKTS